MIKLRFLAVRLSNLDVRSPVAETAPVPALEEAAVPIHGPGGAGWKIVC